MFPSKGLAVKGTRHQPITRKLLPHHATLPHSLQRDRSSDCQDTKCLFNEAASSSATAIVMRNLIDLALKSPIGSEKQCPIQTIYKQ